MQANELRLGNYLYDDTNRYFQVKLIGKKCLHSYGCFIYDLDDVNPIPLTEEILLKSGAVKLDKLFPSYNLHGIVLNMVNNNWIEYVSRVKLNYVHKLQNFYYTHKEQELNIEL